MQTNDKTLMNSQHGLTLTEILVAVVVLSIGLLGMAGIQMKGLRGTHNTFLRSQATALATDLAERIRANPTGISLPDGVAANASYANIGFNNTTCASLTAPATACGTVSGTAASNCTAAQITTYDLYTWMCGSSSTDTINGVRNILPITSTVSTSCVDSDTSASDTDDCSPSSTVTITINWDERDTGNNTSNQNLSMVVVP